MGDKVKEKNSKSLSEVLDHVLPEQRQSWHWFYKFLDSTGGMENMVVVESALNS